MTSLRSWLVVFAASAAFAQQSVPQKPGVPGVQAPMSNLVPDGQYDVGGNPDWLAMAEDSVWTNSKPTDVVIRMDPKSNAVVAKVPVKKPCSGFAVAAGTLWSPSCEEKVIYRIDLTTNEVVAKVPVGPADTEGGIAFGAGSAWMPSDPKGIVSRIDPATNKVIAEIQVAPGSFTAVFGYNLVWVSSTEKGLVSVIQPATNQVIAEIPVDQNPRFMAAGEGYVWTLNQGTGTVSKIDPRTLKVVATIEAGIPGAGGDIATGEGAVWLTQRTVPVTRIDPSNNKVTAQLYGLGGDAMRVGHGYVWLSNGRQGTVWRFLPQKAMPALTAAQSDGAGLQPGTLPAKWMTGGPNCLTVPDWQVHEYNEDFYILRESGCIHYEKPFLYLIFGQEKALLEDTGAGEVQTAPIVTDLLAKWAKRKNHAPVSLVVIHSHGHGDHTAGDKQFQDLPNVQFVAATPDELKKAGGMKSWPTEIGTIDLGGRVVDLIPIPGHNDASIALYDRLTGNLMTGDSLYPGRLYVPEAAIPDYVESAKRLADFVMDHPIAHVLGTHIEQAKTANLDYPTGTAYQPEEHVLELTRAHVLELNDAFSKLNGKAEIVVLPDFSIVPRKAGAHPASLQAGFGAGLQPGVVPGAWKTGGPNCLAVPDWQVHEYNEDFYILRESGCIHYEKPFLYLIFGQEKALLEDTGAGEVQTAPIVMDLLAKWAKRKNHAPVSLVVIHSHAHGDHTAGDKQFQGMPNVQFIAATPAEISKAAGIEKWPTEIGKIDLGGRVIDVIPFPGHNDASIALYDRVTGNLMTGDSLYPGRLSVSEADLPTFTASAQRLADFVGDHPIAHVLGTHIEQTRTPVLDYPRGTTYQPDEHPLALSRAHVIELNEAFISMKGQLQKIALPDFTIVPRVTPPKAN